MNRPANGLSRVFGERRGVSGESPPVAASHRRAYAASHRRAYAAPLATVLQLHWSLMLGTLAVVAAPLYADDPCVSGPHSGQRPGPYSALISTGEHRGQSHCFICETAERPAAIIFARGLSDPLGKLAAKLDQAVADHKASDLRSWVTFLSQDQSAFDPEVVKWSKKNGLRNVPLGVFEDVVGPPSYRLAKDADVTVLLFVKQKVVANFAFRSGELTEAKINAVMKEVPKMIEKK